MNRPVPGTGMPYQRLGGSSGWGEDPRLESVLLDSSGIRLGTAGYDPIPLAEEFGSFGGRTLPRGVAVRHDGQVLLADPDGRVILIHRPGSTGFRPLWPAREVPVAAEHDPVPAPHPPDDPYTLLEPVDVGFAPNGDLVILDAAAGRVLVLAYPGAQLRHVLQGPNWRPTALAFDTRGRACIADELHGDIRRFDARWRRDDGYPHPSTILHHPWQLAACQAPGGRCSGPGAGCCPGTCRIDTAPANAPVLAVLDGAQCVLLDERGRKVADTPLPEMVPGPFELTDGRQLTWQDPCHPELDRLRFPGIGSTRDGHEADSGLPLLAVPRRMRLPRAGMVRLGPIDGERPGFAWDRLALRAGIPAHTRLLVSTLASDSRLEPALLDDAGTPWSTALPLEAGALPELAVLAAPGRYLWIRIEFRGNGEASSEVHGLDVHGPRQGSFTRLPAIYQQEAQGNGFLERFLAYFDTRFAELEATHRDMARYLDPRTVPAGAPLDWLGSWFGWHFEPGWGEAVRREIIERSIDYSARRGSATGIRQLLQWHTGLTGQLPAVIEHFRLPAGPPLVGGQPLDSGAAAHACTVVLPLSVAATVEQRERIDGLLSAHMPAHVRFAVRYIRPGMVLGHQSCIGVDTLLAAGGTSGLGDGALGADLSTGTGTPRMTMRPRMRRETC